jgi:hypothetical protein
MDSKAATETVMRADGAGRVAAAAAGNVAYADAARDAAVDAAAEAAGAERRRQYRERVLKAAKIVFGGGDSVLNCLVLDESPEGIFVDMGAVVALPPEVTIQFSSGAAFRAQRRWTSGTKVGFQFVGPQIISHETAQRMQVVADIMNNHGLAAAMQTLRVAQYFDNVELRRTAEAAEAAMRRLDAVLAGVQALSASAAENGGVTTGPGHASLGGGSRV